MEYKKLEFDTTYTCSLDRVVDGDTVDVCINLGFDVLVKKRCRLYGIDTPESRTSDLVEKKYGLQSKEKLKKWLIAPMETDKDDIYIELRCKKKDMVDKYGRVLGEIWVIDGEKETNINGWLCENHLAVPYEGQNKETIKEAHLKNRETMGTLL